MKLFFAALMCIPAVVCAAGASDAASENAWREHAQRVHIIRDNWGIAHVYGKSDADAVFGMIYRPGEDEFNRIEHNYLVSLGWLAQAEGESALYSDLRARLFIDVGRLQQQYRAAPPWLKALMDAWSDGLNYFLSTHSAVHPKVIRHFEPWMALSFTEGSIGGDIETIDLKQLEKFYGPTPPPMAALSGAATDPVPEEFPGGSNGFAIAPQLTASGHAMLWINPHTSYYFRSELQMVSDAGLNVYGAATWGQFFVYQGFNAHNGWMHTSYGGDAIDESAEAVPDLPQGLGHRHAGGRSRGASSRCSSSKTGVSLPTASRSTAAITARSCAPKAANGSRSRSFKTRCAPSHSRTCGPRPPTTSRFAARRRCAPTHPTIPCMRTPTAPSRTFTAISFRGAMRASISVAPS